MTELVEFLRARYAEALTAAHRKHAPGWGWSDPCYDEAQFAAGPDPALCNCRQRQVLDAIDSKLRVVDECARTLEWEDHGHALARDVLQLLALPFAGHDDYRKEWAVD